MTDADKAQLLRQIFIQNGLVSAQATDAQVQQAFVSAQQANPAGLEQMLKAGGYPVGLPWLTIIGVGAGALAVYFIWKNYSSTKKLNAMDYPEPEESSGDRIRMMGSSLAHLKGGGKKLCGPKRLGGHKKYEFEPETRLEGYRKKRSR